MMDFRKLLGQMTTVGTPACALFGAAIGIIFAILCLTIGVGKALVIGIFCLIGAFIGGVKDKKEFVRSVVLFFHRGDADRYE